MVSRFRPRRFAAFAAASALAAAASLAASAPVAGAASLQVDQTCVLPLAKFDPAVVNVAFPDQAAQYYVGAYAAIPGFRLRIDGLYPHARYMSFNVYDPAIRPITGLADIHIGPDPGSTNPFLPGADRTAVNRRYTAFIDFSAPPAAPAPNTMYVSSPNLAGTFIYRIYMPDTGRDALGGEPLPTVTLEQEGDGAPPPRSLCDELQRPDVPVVSGINDVIAGQSGVRALDGTQPWGQPVPQWRKFVNLPTSFADFLLSNPSFSSLRPLADPVAAAGGSGGFLSNLDNAYVSTAVNRRYGQVLVTSFKAPTFANTRSGVATMPSGVQLRYWSFCQNQTATQRFVACATDDQTAIDRNGQVHYVLSTAAQRPARATAACGYTWLPWGPDSEGALILRHMLPDPSFAQAIQRAKYGSEAQTMGPYLPSSSYVPDAATFDATAPCYPM